MGVLGTSPQLQGVCIERKYEAEAGASETSKRKGLEDDMVPKL